MIILNILGWIANVLFIYGVWIIGDKNVKGFYLNALANLMYMWRSVYLNDHPLFWLSLILITTNLIGIYKWQFKDRKELKKLRRIFNETAGQKYNSELMKFIDKENHE